MIEILHFNKNDQLVGRSTKQDHELEWVANRLNIVDANNYHPFDKITVHLVSGHYTVYCYTT